MAQHNMSVYSTVRYPDLELIISSNLSQVTWNGSFYIPDLHNTYTILTKTGENRYNMYYQILVAFFSFIN